MFEPYKCVKKVMKDLMPAAKGKGEGSPENNIMDNTCWKTWLIQVFPFGEAGVFV